jgi:hypothetical protein
MRDALEPVLLLLVTAVVFGCRLARLRALVEYLVVGILIGPHTQGWVPDTEQTRHLAEFGIVLLMFIQIEPWRCMPSRRAGCQLSSTSSYATTAAAGRASRACSSRNR